MNIPVKGGATCSGAGPMLLSRRRHELAPHLCRRAHEALICS